MQFNNERCKIMHFGSKNKQARYMKVEGTNPTYFSAI
jgi:hypothetical protein